MGDLGTPLVLAKLLYLVVVVYLVAEMGAMVRSSRHPTPVFRGVVALAIFCEWAKIMKAAFALRAIGPQCLPILQAMFGIRAISMIVLMCLVACNHIYFTLAMTYMDVSFWRMWRIGLLGDFDLEEFRLETDEEAPDGMEGPISALFLIITFFFTVLLMNIFIGVVGN